MSSKCAPIAGITGQDNSYLAPRVSFLKEIRAAQSFVSYSFDDGFTDPELHRPAEVNVLQGDAGKARRVPGWAHIREMVDADRRAVGIQ